jgi:catechol 2,3-dioxygenase-like lactoylglutathione lyase family enzyme
MISVRGLDHVVFTVTDVDATLAWWRDLLGAEVLREEEWRRGEVPFVSIRLDATTIIDLFAGDRTGTNVDHVAVLVDADLDDVVASGRIEVEGPPRDLFGAQGQGRGIYTRDPDGNRIELRTY